MAKRGSAKGEHRGGRKKGTPNKLTQDARKTFALVFDNLAPEVEGWIRLAAQEDPSKGADLFLKLAEHFVPKLARHEVTGADGEPLSVSIEINRIVAGK